MLSLPLRVGFELCQHPIGFQSSNGGMSSPGARARHRFEMTVRPGGTVVVSGNAECHLVFDFCDFFGFRLVRLYVLGWGVGD